MSRDEENYRQEIERLELDLESERLRLSACGVVAMQDTAGSRKERLEPGHKCYSASYADVCRRVDECIRLRKAVREIAAGNLDEETVVDFSVRCITVAKEALADSLRSLAPRVADMRMPFRRTCSVCGGDEAYGLECRCEAGKEWVR